jgi:hypothetical protein
VTAAARLAALRIVRAPRSLVPMAGWALVSLVAAVAERRASAPAAGHVLLGVFGSIALPLLVYVVVGATVAGQGVLRASRPLVAVGGDPMRVAAATILVAAAVSALLGALLSPLVAAIAHGPSDPSLARDLPTTAWIGALAGATYAAWFALGAATTRSGVGRGALLAVDWILGVGTGAGAVLTPRAHLRNLLGGAPPLDLSQRASTAALVFLAFAFVVAALTFARRTRG